MNLKVISRWREFPEEPPETLPSNQYLRYLVAYDNGWVQEVSWLGGEWHQRHDGCSEVTKSVRYWMPLPEAPSKDL